MIGSGFKDHIQAPDGFHFLSIDYNHIAYLLNSMLLEIKPPLNSTHLLKYRITRCLEATSSFEASKHNWYKQSTLVDFRDIVLVHMYWLCKEKKLNARVSNCIGNELIYLVEDKHR